MEAKVIREFYAVKYQYAGFGARPDLTHPEMVADLPELSEGRFVVKPCEDMRAAYLEAFRVLGSTVLDGPLRGYPSADRVSVIRVAEHEPVLVDGGLFSGVETVTMTVTGEVVIEGVPHFVDSPLSRYHPVNGWSVPNTVTVRAGVTATDAK